MFAKIIGLCLSLAVQTYADYYTTTDELFNIMPLLDVFDGPANVSYAQTSPTLNTQPTFAQMEYYCYYVASMYCPAQLSDLSCAYCQSFKKDVTSYAVYQNTDQDTWALVTVSSKRKEIVIAFRGTMNAWNVVQNLLFFDTNISTGSGNIKLHTGFLIAALSLYSDVTKAVGCQRELHPTYKIVICGHSLGAAMARVTYFLLSYLDQFPEATYELYTYGEPRVGNKALADFMNDQSIVSARIVKKADVIPHLPPTSILCTELLFEYYIHAQTEYWMRTDASGSFCNTSVYEDPCCSDSLGPVYNQVDHLTYFGLDFAKCGFSQPLKLLALPFSILPSDEIPVFPTVIANFLGAIGDFVINGLSIVNK